MFFSWGMVVIHIVYIYIHMHMCIYLYICIYIEHATSIVGSLRDSIKCSGFFLTVQDLVFAA